jgi:hypothetical protein
VKEERAIASRNHASHGAFLHDALAARAPAIRPAGSV